MNVTPSEQTLTKIDEAVEKYGQRHRVAKNRNNIAADILDKYIDLWLELLVDDDDRLNQQLERLKRPKAAKTK